MKLNVAIPIKAQGGIDRCLSIGHLNVATPIKGTQGDGVSLQLNAIIPVTAGWRCRSAFKLVFSLITRHHQRVN